MSPEQHKWFYKVANAKQGPFTTDQLLKMIVSREVPHDTPVWRFGMEAWAPAVQLEELFPEGLVPFVATFSSPIAHSDATGRGRQTGLLGILFGGYRDWHAKHPKLSALLLFLMGLIALRTAFTVFLWLGSFANAGEQRHAVIGNVTWEGGPLGVGIISFRPLEKQRFNSGAAIQNGLFSIPADKGLLPGKYLVRINSAVADPSFPAPPPGERDTRPGIEILPQRYNAQSELTAEVGKWGQTRLSFELKP